MCNERTDCCAARKEWPDALRRRAARIVPAYKFKLSQYRISGLLAGRANRVPATAKSPHAGVRFEDRPASEVRAAVLPMSPTGHHRAARGCGGGQYLSVVEAKRFEQQAMSHSVASVHQRLEILGLQFRSPDILGDRPNHLDLGREWNNQVV